MSYTADPSPAEVAITAIAVEFLAGKDELDATVRRRRRARTAIGRAVLKNKLAIHFLAALFFDSINERLEALRQGRSNSDEAAAEIAEYEDLKRKIKAFLGAASRFAETKDTEASIVETTTSFATGIKNWWSKRHVEISDKA